MATITIEVGQLTGRVVASDAQAARILGLVYDRVDGATGKNNQEKINSVATYLRRHLLDLANEQKMVEHRKSADVAASQDTLEF